MGVLLTLARPASEPELVTERLFPYAILRREIAVFSLLLLNVKPNEINGLL